MQPQVSFLIVGIRDAVGYVPLFSSIILRPTEKMSLSTETTDDCARQVGADLENVLRELTAIRADLVADPAIPQRRLDDVDPNYRDSARNLLHYLTLRRRDVRPLQIRLASLGLSSLGRAESHVLATVDAVLRALHRLAGYPWQQSLPESGVTFTTGQKLLAEHTGALLGPATPGRAVRIMVTMPSEAGTDYNLVHDLLRQGMDCMRINCAHDDAATWLRMIDHLKRAEHSLGRSCRIVMDLAGPKLRTGPLEPGPSVVRIRPCRDVHGRVIAPARVWLTPESAPCPPPSPADTCFLVPATWLARLRKGERVHAKDARDAKRTFKIVDATDRGCWAEATKTAYVVPGTVLRHEHERAERDDCEARVGDLPTRENAIWLRPGDSLVLTRDRKPGRPATHDSSGRIT
jgi:pyruvate kinase